MASQLYHIAHLRRGKIDKLQKVLWMERLIKINNRRILETLNAGSD